MKNALYYLPIIAVLSMASSNLQRPTNTQKRTGPKRQRVNSFDSLVQGKELYIVAGIIILLAILVLRNFLFGNQIYLFKDIGSDTINAYYPHYFYLADYFHTHGIPTWSFYQGMGTNLFPNSLLGQPLEMLLLFMGKNNIAGSLAGIEFMKIVIGGVFFFLFLRTAKLSAYSALIGSIVYAFSGYMMVGGTWAIFSTEAVYMAFWLFAFEKLLSENRWYWMPLAAALWAVYQPVYMYVYTLFMVLYATIRYFEQDNATFIGYGKLIGRCAALVLLGVGIGSIMTLSLVWQILHGPRVGGEASYASKLSSFPIFGMEQGLHNRTAIARFFSNDLLGNGSNFRGWYNYLEAPMFYCGLIMLVVVPQIFISLSRRRVILYSSALCFGVLPIIFPFFRYAFWLFSGDYYRAFSLVVALIFIVLGTRALHTIETKGVIHWIALASSLVFLCLLLFVGLSGIEGIDNGIRGLIFILLLLHAGAVAMMKPPTLRNVGRWALLCLVCGEAFLFANITINKRSTMTTNDLTGKIGYNDYTVDAATYLNLTDKTFFRVDKDFNSGLAIHASINDGKIQGFRTTPSYYHMNQLNYIRFLDGVGVIDAKNEYQTRWAQGVIGRPMLETICNVKYIFTRGNKNLAFWTGAGFEPMKQFGDVTIFKNMYALPFGFCYDSVIVERDFKMLSLTQKDKMLLRACVIPDTIPSKGFVRKYTADTTLGITADEMQRYVLALRKDSVQFSTIEETAFQGKITLSSKKILYLSIPMDEGWRVVIDGRPTQPLRVNLGFIGIPLDAGSHVIQLTFQTPLIYPGLVTSLSCGILYIGLLIFFRPYKNEKVQLGDGKH
jgi:uncharacterized membrane protein YfhO